jgi:photosystem II stability/assembly factor-like uncharacterized protein
MKRLCLVVLVVVCAAGCWKIADVAQPPPAVIASEEKAPAEGGWATPAKTPSIEVKWEPLGPGGGGGVYTPSISPHDPRLMFLACDMGGWYRSTDGGNHWRMCDGRQVRKVNFNAVFHPTDPNVIYVGTRGGIVRSTDRGETWEHVVGEYNPASPDMVRAIAFAPGRPEVIFAAFSTFLGKPGEYLVRSVNAGKTWWPVGGWPAGDKPIQKILFSPKPTPGIFVATADGFFRSDDGGATWVAKNAGLPNTKIHDAAAGHDAVRDVFAIFVTLDSQWIDGKFAGGICRSLDGGDTWTQVTNGLDVERVGTKLHAYRFLAMSPANPRVVSVTTVGTANSAAHSSTVYRTEDGGDTWKRILFGEPTWPECNVEPDWLTAEMAWSWGGTAEGFGCNPNDPNDVVFTDAGRAIRTTDGGKHWLPLSSKRVGKDSWDGRGLEVTTCYTWSFDPFDRDRTYVTYTDFGLMRSLDRGKTWIYGGRKVPWSSNCYALAFDPARKGVVFGAWSSAHDLMHWKMIRSGILPGWRGGITKSTDHGETWSVLGGGELPAAPVTTLVLDPKSPADSRTLYAGILGRGVYKSTDDGKTWTNKSAGLGAPEHLSIWRLDLHPDGTLLCGISLSYKDGKPVPGGLYRSRDGAGTWEKVKDFPYLWGVRMDPRDSKVIYVSCFDVPPAGYQAMGTNVPWPDSEGGGLFKTTDGGATWTKVLAERYCWDVTFDPKNPDVVYAGTFVGGVYRSKDAGRTWSSLAGLPFIAPHRVTVDPEDAKTIYVTTFGGGVWKGQLP